MKLLFKAVLLFLFLSSCNRHGKLKVVLSRFPNNDIKEVIYLDLPITTDSTGEKEIYFENGKLQAKGNYKNGKREGKWVCYKRNGKLEWRADYKNGLENGLVECFNENGNWRKMNMLNGCEQGATTEYNIDSTGREIWVSGLYKNSKEDSLWVWTNKHGVVTARGYYTEGKPDKYYETYYNNGFVFSKAFLRNGYIDSLLTFDSLGRLIDTKYYHNATLSN